MAVATLAAALLLPAAGASAWVREAAPGVGTVFQSGSSLSVLPDGTVRYIAAKGKLKGRVAVTLRSGATTTVPLTQSCKQKG